MKSASDPRHQKRREAIKELFAASFAAQSTSELVREIIKNAPDLDIQISHAAPAWPIDKLNKMDLAILRYAVYELQTGQVPPKVTIDEAVELAKEFGSESSPSFVNGVLGTILKNQPK
jgi:N utilization substance protein B